MDVDALQNEVERLNLKIKDLEEHLKKYTNPERCHRYYNNHKEELNVKHKEYRKTLSKETISQYNKRYYERKKEKLASENTVTDATFADYKKA